MCRILPPWEGRPAGRPSRYLASTRVLAVADELSDALEGDALARLRPDVIVSCGDLPFEYLENLVSRTDKPLLYVPGNHDPEVRNVDSPWMGLTPDLSTVGPAGCLNVDGRIHEEAGLRIGGLGGSIRYRPGPNQYTQRQMRWRALRLELRARLAMRRIDVLLVHAALPGFGDADDPAHRGFTAVKRLVERLQPRILIHGHVRHYGPKTDDMHVGETLVVNAIPYRLLEL